MKSTILKTTSQWYTFSTTNRIQGGTAGVNRAFPKPGNVTSGNLGSIFVQTFSAKSDFHTELTSDYSPEHSTG